MFVVTLPKAAEKDPLTYAKKAKEAGADILEIRGDLTPHIDPFQSPIPLLVSPRGTGSSLIDVLRPLYVDLELSEVSMISGLPNEISVILSFHDYEKTPDENFLENIVQQMCSHNPSMIKIATTITSYDDYSVLQNVRSLLNKKSVQSTILGMGPKSHLSRILSPLENTFTYACLSLSDAAASGQLTLAQYARMKHVQHPTICGLLGGSHIGASLSPFMHSIFAETTKADLVYALFPTEDLEKSFITLKDMGVTGFSVTAPWKREILHHVTSIDPLVSRLGSANTVVVRGEESIAYNTDVDGIVSGYPFLKDSQHVAILGSGGVVPAIVHALRVLNPDVVVSIFARSSEAEHALRKCDCSVLPLDEVSRSRADTFICAISDDIALPLPSSRSSSLQAHRFEAIDLRYATPTKFLIDAEEKGYTTHNGLPMLLFQAFAQFQLFTDREILASDRASIASSMRAAMHDA